MSDDMEKSSLDKVDIDDFFGEDAVRPTSIDEFDAQFASPNERSSAASPESTPASPELDLAPESADQFATKTTPAPNKSAEPTKSTSPVSSTKSAPTKPAPARKENAATPESKPASLFSQKEIDELLAVVPESEKEPEIVFKTAPNKPSPTKATPPQGKPQPGATQPGKAPRPGQVPPAQKQSGAPSGYANVPPLANKGAVPPQHKSAPNVQYAPNAQNAQTTKTPAKVDPQQPASTNGAFSVATITFTIFFSFFLWAFLKIFFKIDVEFESFCCWSSIIIFFLLNAVRKQKKPTDPKDGTKK